MTEEQKQKLVDIKILITTKQKQCTRRRLWIQSFNI